jgi:hypothetical protein
MERMVAVQSTLRIPEGVLFREVEGAGVLLNTTNGQYFMLDEMGTRMWGLICQHRQLEPVYAAVLAEYDVDAGRLEGDLAHFVEELLSQQLLELDDDVAQPGQRAAWPEASGDGRHV